MDNEARILLDDVIAFCRRDGRETRLINMLEQCGATGFDRRIRRSRSPADLPITTSSKQRELIERYLEEDLVHAHGPQRSGSRGRSAE